MFTEEERSDEEDGSCREHHQANREIPEPEEELPKCTDQQETESIEYRTSCSNPSKTDRDDEQYEAGCSIAGGREKNKKNDRKECNCDNGCSPEHIERSVFLSLGYRRLAY